MYRLIVLVFVCLPLFARAQKENNIWIFPLNVGLDFNTPGSGPKVFKPVIDNGTAPASICDEQGNLLFYTNGDSVWNKAQQVMPNGTGLRSSFYTYTQSTIVVPVINQPSKYYLFTIQENINFLYYSVIDMSLDHGMGDIIQGQKRMFLAKDIAPSMTAIRGDGCYTWLLAHSRSAQHFLAFRIGANGIDTTPVVSSAFTHPAANAYAIIDIAASPSRKKIALGLETGYSFIDLYDFDPATGAVSNAQLLDSYGSYGRAHGVCFSPSGAYLYVTGGHSGDDLTQYDLTKLPATAALNVNGATYLNGGMRLGPDGKIYCANYDGVYTILYPDSPGTACGFSTNYVTLPAGVQSFPRQLGENMVKPSFQDWQASNDTVLCDDQPAVLHSRNPGKGQVWNNGDTAAARTVRQTGKYWVKSFNDCDRYTDTFNVLVSSCNCIVSLPDAFTPDNDGHNDRFRILGTDVLAFNFRIYNRYGQCVYQSTDPAQSWDGNYNGKQCEMGSYFYFFTARCIKGQEVFRKGEVLLIR